MIDPTFRDTVTLYHKYTVNDEIPGRTVTKWQKTVLKNCFFGEVSAVEITGTQVSSGGTYVCRIPHQCEVLPGDIIVCGEVSDEIADISGQRSADLLNRYKYKSFTVKSVSDNKKLPTAQHIRVSGV